MPDTFIKLANPTYPERTAFTLTAYFRDSSGAADTPTTVDYRIDDLTTDTAITGWTSATPGTSVNITITPTENRMVYNRNRWERRQLVVSSDRGLSTETRDIVQFKVLNTGGFDE